MKSQNLKPFILALALSALSIPAMAQNAPQYSFHPVKTWVPENMPNPATGGQFCTIRNEYNNGFVLQFASGGNGLDLLAMNFRQEIFEAGRDYTIAMNVDNGTPQNFKARANKPDQLKIFLSGRTDFYTLLKSGSALDVKIEGNNFRFELAGFGDAAKNIDQCAPGALNNHSAAAGIPAAVEKPEELAASMAPPPVKSQAPPTSPPSIAKTQAADMADDGPMTVRMTDKDFFENRPSKKLSPEAQTARDEIFKNQQARKPDNNGEDAMEGESSMKAAAAAPLAEKAPAPLLPAPTPRPALKVPPQNTPLPPPVQPQARQATPAPAVAAASSPSDADVKPLPAPNSAPAVTVAPIAKDNTASAKPAEKPAEKITWNPAPPVKPADTAPAVKPLPVPPSISAPAPLQKTEQAAPPAETASSTPQHREIRSPEMEVHTDRRTMQADFTKVESDFERGGEGPSAVNKNKNAPAPFTAPVEKIAIRHTDKPPVDADNNNEDTAFADTPAPVKKDTAPSFRNDPEMGMKISDLEQQVQKLKTRNEALDAEVKSNLHDSQDERTSISSNNWDLEKATTRYNEADREIKRLAQKLQQQKAQCDVEKKDMEAMLFDPRVTSEQQMAKLADLEQQLTKANQDLTDQRMQYETRIKELEKRSTP